MLDRLRSLLSSTGGRGSSPDDPRTAPPAGDAPAPPPTARSARTSSATRVDGALGVVATWAFRVIVIAAALYIAGWLIQQTWSLLLPLVLALLLSTILWPLMRLASRALPPSFAAFAVLLAFVALLVAIVSLLVPRVAAEGEGLVDQLYKAADDLRKLLSGPPLNLDADRLAEMMDGALGQLQQHQQAIATGVLSGVSSLGTFLVNFVLVLFLVFFLLKDGPKFVPWLRRWLPSQGGAHVDALAGRIWAMLTGFIWSQAAVALIDAVVIGIGLWVLDVPFAFPLAVVIFFASFIPIIGAIATGVLAVAVALVDQGVWVALAVLAIVLVVQQLEGNLLQPFLVGRALSLHPAVVLGAVTIGGTVFGIVGAFLAVPVAGAGVTVLRYARERAVEPEPAAADGPVTTAGAAPEEASDEAAAASDTPAQGPEARD
ncbi:putative PurR-regulated permease PerM [Murinocardiopsis flavida]|uniref:Putative PurR-regulated permease PerM n=1 Tax=Murinocardiopsis flavida TaxID=645275 RepID=A0A2P8DUH8_9ACTN|nr:AI-2E family transporter [Murinocardiopsis flavida]PSL00879.1 putative PurR-regulated permease PerM [Murinocardiopsis flavida]